MKNPISRQTPLTALATLVTIVTVCFIRYAQRPFDNEIGCASYKAPFAEMLSTFESAYPTWSIAIAAVLTILAGAILGRMCNRLRLYPAQCFMPMPLYAIVACGIFISAEPMTAAFVSLLTVTAFVYMSLGYLRGEDLSSMLYAGLAIGAIVMLSAPVGAATVAMAVIAMLLFTLSLRESLTLTLSILFVPAASCYISWIAGGEFLQPLRQLYEALITPSDIPVFGYDAVGALIVAGLSAFAAICSSVLFIVNRFAVAVKPRITLIYTILSLLISTAMCAIPSATPAVLAVAAVPAATVMPVVFIYSGRRASAVLYVSMIVSLIIHLFMT